MKFILVSFLFYSFFSFSMEKKIPIGVKQLLECGFQDEIPYNGKIYVLNNGEVVEKEQKQNFIVKKFPGHEGQISYLLFDDHLALYELPNGYKIICGEVEFLQINLPFEINKKDREKHILKLEDGFTFNLSKLFKKHRKK